jgi:hypothetical protein
MNGTVKWISGIVAVLGIAGGLLAQIIIFNTRLAKTEQGLEDLKERFEVTVQVMIKDLQDRARPNQEQEE